MYHLITCTILFSSLACLAAPRPILRWQSSRPNEDSSVTFTEPYLLRGDEKLMVSGQSHPEGVCKLLGHKHALPDLVVTAGDLAERTAVIGENGEQSGFRTHSRYESNPKTSEITCYDSKELILPVFRHIVAENPDGSSTIGSMTASWGGRIYKLSAHTAPNTLCRVFGFDEHLADTYYPAGDSAEPTILLKENGTYGGIRKQDRYTPNPVAQQLTCYFKKAPPELLPVHIAQERKSNLDGTVTLSLPKVRRANGTYAVSGHSDPESICRLFSFDHFLPDTFVTHGDSDKATVLINNQKRYGGYRRSDRYTPNPTVSALTCYFD